MDYCTCAYFDGCPVHDIGICNDCGEYYWKDKPHKHAGFIAMAARNTNENLAREKGLTK